MTFKEELDRLRFDLSCIMSDAPPADPTDGDRRDFMAKIANWNQAYNTLHEQRIAEILKGVS